MSRIRSKDTGIEKRIRSMCHKEGLRFRVHRQDLPGKPDMVFVSAKLAVFLDGDFWHGWDYEDCATGLKPYWKEKIAKNIERDKKVNHQLEEQGWRVLRFWEHDIKEDPEMIVREISELVH